MIRERRIRKVKLDGTRVEITAMETWGISNEREWTLRCSEDPDPAFPASLKALPTEIRNLLGLPERWADDALKVLSVTFSWSASTGVAGASICCRADLDCATSPLIFNTPHLPYEQYSEGGAQPTMPPELVKLLDVVEAHANAYMSGTRAQEDLFTAKPAKGKDAAAGEGRPEQPAEPNPEPQPEPPAAATSPEPEPMPTPGPSKAQRVKAKATADKYFSA